MKTIRSPSEKQAVDGFRTCDTEMKLESPKSP